MSDVVAIALAAGLSPRMRSRNKLLEEIGGKVLLERTVSIYAKISGFPVVATGFEKAEVEKTPVSYNVAFVHKTEYENGQMTSVDKGLRASPKALGVDTMRIIKNIIAYFRRTVFRQLTKEEAELLASIKFPCC